MEYQHKNNHFYGIKWTIIINKIVFVIVVIVPVIVITMGEVWVKWSAEVLDDDFSKEVTLPECAIIIND